jgi:hypothetical protein
MPPRAPAATLDEEGNPLAGWLAGAGIIALIFVIGLAFWVEYHGI